MQMKLSDIAMDNERSERGAWVDDIPELEGLKLCVRGINNSDWRRLQTKLIESVPRKKRVGRLDPDEADRIQSTCLLQACLLDWDGLENDDGSPIPYDKDMARRLLFEPQFRKFRDGVVWAGTVVGDQTAEAQKETLGNLSALSNSISDGERKQSTG
jgi:hypothetical protein